MELIPILSTIILVATMMTFILSIGAYILYKVRERRGQHLQAEEPTKIRAEIFSPEEQEMEEPMPSISAQPYYQPVAQQSPMYGPQPGAAQQYYQPAVQYPDNQKQQAKSTGGHAKASTTGSRYLKYTSEGYVAPKEESKGQVKWR